MVVFALIPGGWGGVGGCGKCQEEVLFKNPAPVSPSGEGRNLGGVGSGLSVIWAGNFGFLNGRLFVLLPE